MSNRLFQGVVHQMRDTINRVIGVVDDTATIIACSELSKIGTNNEYIALDIVETNDVFLRDGYTYSPSVPTPSRNMQYSWKALTIRRPNLPS